MIVPRREFLKLLGVAAGGAGLGGCGRPWLIPDERVELALRGPGIPSEVQTVCGLCEGSCGLTVRLVDGLPVGLKGNRNHPLNRGGICPVGQAGLEILYAPERLRGPQMRQADGALAPASWKDALAAVGRRIAELRDAGASDRIALLSSEPSALLFALAEHVMHALGSPSAARLSASASAPFTLCQGLSEPPGFDLEGADLVLAFGLDLYEDGAAPLHAIAAMVGVRDRPGTLVHVGTRLSPSATKAADRVSVRPGTEAAFALGIANVLVREGAYDRDFVAERTFGFEDWTDEDGRPRLGFRRALVERYYPDRAARLCGCDPTDVVRVARRFAAADAPLALAGGPATTGTNATWTVLAVHALNALMGRLDAAGGVVPPAASPLSPLPALTTPAVADGSVFAAARREAFAGDPIGALAANVLDGSSPVELLLVVGTDVAGAHPARARFLAALERIPTVVAMTPVADDTADRAQVVLPTPVFLEGWHGETTPSGVPFSVVGVAQPVVEPLHDTRSAGDVLLELGHAALGDGADGLPWSSYADYLSARLRGLEVAQEGAVATGSFEESWVHFLEERGWRFVKSEREGTFREALLRQAAWWNPVRAHGRWDRLLRTESGRYEFHALALERRLRELGAAAGTAADGDDALARGAAVVGLAGPDDELCLPHYEPPVATGDGELLLIPFRPLTARGRLGGLSSMVQEMSGYAVLTGWQIWAEIAATSAAELDLHDGDRVALVSDRGRLEAVVRVQPGAAPGTVHVPTGLGDELRDGGATRPSDLMAAARDPVAGRPSLCSTRVRVRLVERRWGGRAAPHDGGDLG